MSYPRRWSYQFPDGEYRVLCNQTYFAANNGEDDDIYFIVEDAEWALLFPHHPRVMVEHVCKLTDFPDTQTYRVEIQVDFTPQFYVREITATSPEAAQRIAENVAAKVNVCAAAHVLAVANRVLQNLSSRHL